MFSASVTRSQFFLAAFKEYKFSKIVPKLKSKQRKEFIRLTNEFNAELDTIFNSYKSKTGFNFNTADSLFMIIESPVEAPFLGDIIIWSGKDTLSYSRELKTLQPYKYEKKVVYKPYLVSFSKLTGYKEITERDSLVTLVSKRDFTTIQNLGKNQSLLDGSEVIIYVAQKINGKYRIETCSPPQFFLPPVYQKQ